MSGINITRTVILLLSLALSSVLAAGGEKNRTRVRDPLQRVMLEFNLYQVREREGERSDYECECLVSRKRWSH